MYFHRQWNDSKHKRDGKEYKLKGSAANRNTCRVLQAYTTNRTPDGEIINTFWYRGGHSIQWRQTPDGHMDAVLHNDFRGHGLRDFITPEGKWQIGCRLNTLKKSLPPPARVLILIWAMALPSAAQLGLKALSSVSDKRNITIQ